MTDYIVSSYPDDVAPIKRRQLLGIQERPWSQGLVEIFQRGGKF